MSRKITATIAGATLFLIIVSLFSKGIGLFREVVFAKEFGLSNAYDLYLVAAVFPLVINTILYYIAQNYFVPLLNKVKSSGGDTIFLFQKNFWFFTLSGLALAGILSLFSEPLLKLYVGDPYYRNADLIKNIFLIFLITIPFSSAIALLSAYLNAQFEFRIPALSQLILNIFVVVVVLTLTDRLFIYSIPVGFIIGTILQFLFLMFFMKFKIRQQISLFNLKSILSGFNIDKMIILIIIIEIIGQFYLLIDRWFYKSVEQGGLSALNYATTLFHLPISLISISFSAVLLPYFSKDFSTSDSNIFEGKLLNAIKINTILFLPVFLIFYSYSSNIVEIIYERGVFSSSDTVLTADVLKLMSVGLVFFAGYSILNKALFATGRIKTLLIISLIGVILKILLSFILIERYKQNGLALSTILVYSFFFFSSLFVLFKEKKGIFHYFLHFIYYAIIAFLGYILIEILKATFLIDSLISNAMLIILYFGIYIISVYILDPSLYNRVFRFNKRNTVESSQIQ